MGLFSYWKKKDLELASEPEQAPQIELEKPVERSKENTAEEVSVAEPTHQLTAGINVELSAAFNAAHNHPMVVNFHNLFPTKKSSHVYVFNVSEQEFELSRPPNFKKILIPGKSKDEEYALAFSLPQPLPVPRGNVDADVSEIVWEDARRVAMDIIDPDNLGIDQKNKITCRMCYGCDLSMRGVFWSMHKVPTKTEIKRARIKMENHYRNLLEQVWVIQMAGGTLDGVITPEHHIAADYFQQDLLWHPRRPDTRVKAKNQTQGA